MYPFFEMLMAVICATVGALTFARTEARQGEITAESAREASPGRIMLKVIRQRV